METMHPHSFNTTLYNRILWYDGDSTVVVDNLVEMIQKGISVSGLFVDKLTPDIEQYNMYTAHNEQITTKTQNNTLCFDWNIPIEYMQLDISEYIRTKLIEESYLRGWLPTLNLELDQLPLQIKTRIDRIAYELDLYKKNNSLDILRTLIYIINTLETNNIVWGIGRGSSVASYILYLIGVHDVDSIDYELDITDFLRNSESSGEK